MQIKRRTFLLLGSLLGLSRYIHAKELTSKELASFEKEFKRVRSTIASVQEHLFPQNSYIPSAKEMKTIDFLFDTMAHKSFDKDIRAFVIEGAAELEKREQSRFTSLSYEEKERALRAYEETNYGSSWLSRIMTLTMEGLFCDPVYGSNIKEAGWKALGSFGGKPRPSVKYLEI